MNGASDLPGPPRDRPRAALTGGPRPRPLPLQPKTARCPVVPPQPRSSLAGRARGHRRRPCPVCELPLVSCSWQRLASRPHSPLPSPYPQRAAQPARRGGTDGPTVGCKKVFDEGPHPPSGGKNEPLVHPSSRDLPAYLLVPGCPRSPEGNCSTGQGAHTLAHRNLLAPSSRPSHPAV